MLGGGFKFFAQAALLFVLALAVRSDHLATRGPQPDERHWTSRTAVVIKKFAVDPFDSTTQLPHPGLPAVIGMALGQKLGEKFNGRYGFAPGDPGFISRLTASRFACAIFAALAVPLLFLFAARYMGPLAAWLAALLLALDPLHVGVSRWAHLDTALSTLVLATTVVFFEALRRDSLPLKLLAGALWGLALADKPTAVALVPAFLLGGLVWRVYVKRRPFVSSILSWSDLGVLAAGHAVFALIYTRFFKHPSEYSRRMGVHSKLAVQLYDFGEKLSAYSGPLVGLACVGLLFGSWSAYRASSSSGIRWRYHLSLVAITLAAFIGLLAWRPVLIENVTLYWSWVLGLSKVAHEHFGHLALETRHGYFNLLVQRMPLIGSTAFGLGVLLSIFRFWRGDRSERAYLPLLCAIAVLLWLVALNTSSKQTWRYALPVVPLLLMVSAGLVVAVLEWLSSRWGFRRLPVCGVVLLAGIQGAELWSWMPYPELYFSPYAGGLVEAARNHILPLTGHREAIAFLLEQERRGEERPRITVLGDAETQQYTLKNFFPDRATALRFGDFPVWQSDYLMIFHGSGYPVDQNRWGGTLSKTPVFEFLHRGIAMLSIYETVPYAGSHALTFKPEGFHLLSGSIGALPGESARRILVGTRMRAPGYVYFLDGLKLAPGRYRFAQEFRLLESAESGGEAELVRLEIPGVCAGSLPLSDLRTGNPRILAVDCEVAAGTSLFPRVFWSGAASFAAAEMHITQLQ